jgi:hypothetical protein
LISWENKTMSESVLNHDIFNIDIPYIVTKWTFKNKLYSSSITILNFVFKVMLTIIEGMLYHLYLGRW